MRTRNLRRGVPALLLVTAGLALAACGPSDDSGSASDPSSSAPSASSSDSSASSSQGSPAAPSATASAPGAGADTTAPSNGQPGTGGAAGGSTQPACATSQLKTTAENFDHGAGSTMFELVFQNTGSAPCTLHGYPGVSFVKAHNTQLGKAAARTGGATPVVTLIPNAHAYADVRTVNGEGGYSAAQCDLTTVPTLRIYPPNQTESTNVPWNRQECVGSDVQNLQVGPVHSNR